MSLIIIGNEKIYKKDSYISCNSFDLENILESFKKTEINLLCRKGNQNNCKYKFTFKQFNLISFFDLFELLKKNQNKVLLISITPFSFLLFLALKFLSKKICCIY